MYVLGKRLKQLREQHRMNQSDIRKLLNLSSSSTISQYESGERVPSIDNLKRLAAFFEVSVDYLIGLNNDSGPENHAGTVPIIGSIRAGTPLLAEENWDDALSLAEYGADFALTVIGDSMSWAGIYEGDIALLISQQMAQNGDIVAAGVENDYWAATLKFFVQNGKETFLRPANPLYPDIPYTSDYRIIGKLVKVIKQPPSLHDYQAMLSHKYMLDESWSKAIEKATQHNLDGESVLQMIELFRQINRQ
ncbi:LexA family protein [Anoxynatronum sibiricum]|uniref:S24 family peptidase n=1 Tax=Anoxynatronum sibiricum TaxID=210623 RepID=A0ABU9VR64_9CLOT